jgi:murein DD-endopeptidase MepM/ murein hydrolase activator NlpD
MTLHSLTLTRVFDHLRARMAHAAHHACECAARQPVVTVVVLLAAGIAFGAGARTGVGFAQVSLLQQQVAQQQAQLDSTRDQAQREVNALAARLGELQAEANRLNALGERLTQVGQLGDGEIDFDAPVGVGGTGPVRDMPAGELRAGLGQLGAQFKASGEQLSVLESLLFNRKLDQDATPSRMPIANTYITSGFGGRADPFGGGRGYHKGIDFHARMGDPVMAVADGVVSYAGVRSGYGNVVEIDHGNGYVTRYAHNSRLLVRVGDLVRSGQQVARAGSTGRSTGAHVHFEVWDNGRVVNPRKFLGRAQVASRG